MGQPEMSNVTAAPPTGKNLPIIDMSSLQTGIGIKELAGKVNEACKGTSFFLVANHGIPENIIDSAMQASRLFFEQPIEARMKSLKDEFHRGYLPFGTTQYPGQGPDLKDTFDVGIDLPLDDPQVKAGLPLHGPNQWPDLENFRTPVETYFTAIHQLGLQLLEVFALSLNIDQQFFTQYYTKPTVLMRMMHYLPQSSSLSSNSIGATAHTDFGLMTILNQDNLGGLEIQLLDGSWISAPSIPGTFVVNIGQLMARWTNDVYKATTHRVINRSNKERYSIPFFFNPNHYAKVQCIPSCQSPERPPKYSDVLAGEHIANLVAKNQDFTKPTKDNCG